ISRMKIMGHSIVNFHHPRFNPSLTAKDIDAFCLQHPMLAKYKRPRYYRFVDELPMTATGKKVHYKVRQQVVADAEKGLLEKV
ncbi:MAG: hypothetical protein AB7S84_13485, partial [Desulfococcus sp.]